MNTPASINEREQPYLLSEGISAIANGLKAILVDVWGVVFDGNTIIEGTAETFTRANECGCQCVLISNTARKSSQLLRMLGTKGLSSELVRGAVTAGDITSEFLNEQIESAAAFGRRYQMIGHQEGGDSILSAKFERVEDITSTDFLFVVGRLSSRCELETLGPFLKMAQSKNIPMVVANSDRELRIGREVFPAAGAIADAYASLNGKVFEFGKPRPEIFRRACALAGTSPDEVIVIGDSIRSDIVGARAAGMRSILITGTGLQQEIATMDHSSVRPNYYLPCLRW